MRDELFWTGNPWKWDNTSSYFKSLYLFYFEITLNLLSSPQCFRSPFKIHRRSHSGSLPPKQPSKAKDNSPQRRASWIFHNLTSGNSYGLLNYSSITQRNEMFLFFSMSETTYLARLVNDLDWPRSVGAIKIMPLFLWKPVTFLRGICTMPCPIS